MALLYKIVSNVHGMVKGVHAIWGYILEKPKGIQGLFGWLSGFVLLHECWEYQLTLNHKQIICLST
jgi:hypothetical protein